MNDRRRGGALGQGGAEPGQVVRVDDLADVRGVHLALAGAAQVPVNPGRVVGRAGLVDRRDRPAVRPALNVERAAAGLALEEYSDGHVELDAARRASNLDDPLERDAARPLVRERALHQRVVQHGGGDAQGEPPAGRHMRGRHAGWERHRGKRRGDGSRGRREHHYARRRAVERRAGGAREPRHVYGQVGRVAGGGKVQRVGGNGVRLDDDGHRRRRRAGLVG